MERRPIFSLFFVIFWLNDVYFALDDATVGGEKTPGHLADASRGHTFVFKAPGA